MRTHQHSRSPRCAASIAQAMLLSLAILVGCQKPTEPSDVVVGNGFATTVNVKDQTGNPVTGAQVFWALKKDSAIGAEKRMSETGVGIYTDVIPVPISDSNIAVMIRTVPPKEDPELATGQKNGTFRLDTIRVCGSTVLNVELIRSLRITGCGQSLACSDLLLSAAPPTLPTATACTKEYTNNTGEPLTIPVPTLTPADPTIRTYIVVDNGPQQSGTATVTPGSVFRICFELTPGSTASSTLSDHTVTLTGSTPSDPNCLRCQFGVRSVVTIGSTCDCPAAFPQVDYPGSATSEVLCVGSSASFPIPLTSVKNTNDDPNCVLLFDLDPTQTIDPDIHLTSLDGGATASGAEVPKGGSLGSLDLTFSPTSARSYTQLIRYKVRLKNVATGAIQDCPNALTIIFHGSAGNAACAIDYANSTLIKTPPRLTDTLRQGADQDVTAPKMLCIQNTGEGCNLVIDRVTLTGDAVFEVDPGTLPISIPPNGSACLPVKFLPTTADVWPNGRSNAPKTIFHGTLTVGTNPACGEKSFDIVGEVILQPYNSSCFLEWSSANGGYKGGMFFSDKGELTFPLKDDRNQLAVYVQSIDLAATPPSAVLASGQQSALGQYAYFKSEGTLNLGTKDICDFASDPTKGYPKDCPDRSGEAQPAGYNTTAKVSAGDVLVISYWHDGKAYCALMIITDIRLDKDPNVGSGDPQVCFQVCFPL